MLSATGLTAHLGTIVATASDGEGFVPPSISDFFPDGFALVGSPLEINRVIMVRLIMTAVIVLVFGIGAARARVVPGRFQGALEMLLGFVRKNIAEEILGPTKGRQYAPILTTLFIGILFMNISGIIPGLQIAATSIIGMPIVYAVVAYITFVAAGLKAHGLGGFLRGQLVPAGVPGFLYVLIVPIEFLSNLIMRPVTLTIRLLANMISGHLLLALCFVATHALFFTAAGALKAMGVVTLAAGLAFILFEAFVAALQAYIFALLTAVYIDSAVNTH